MALLRTLTAQERRELGYLLPDATVAEQLEEAAAEGGLGAPAAGPGELEALQAMSEDAASAVAAAVRGGAAGAAAAGQGGSGGDGGAFGDEAEPPASAELSALLASVARPARQLRLVLEAAEAKEKEREWIANKTTGEIDDNKLVEGVTGEKNIYRARGEPEKRLGLHQLKPKRLSFCFDVSSSMARGNGWDGRLDRMVQCAVMLVEGLRGFEHKFEYEMVGHSGSGPRTELVRFGEPPRTPREVEALARTMRQHASGCASGDSTLETAALAVAEVLKADADDYFVFVLSDANLGRYDVQPDELGARLRGDERVNGYAIFIAEPGAAMWMKKELPFGHGFVCLEVDKLPATFKDIFAHAAVS